MNRFAKGRLTKYVSSGLSVMALVVVGTSIDDRTDSALAAAAASSFSSSLMQSDSTPAGKKAAPPDQTGEQSKPAADARAIESDGADLDADVAGSPLDEDSGAGLEEFHATAYSLKGRTASGEFTRPGIIAADPRVLPLGTVVHIRAGKYTGTYTVKDTGGMIRGRRLDIYVASYREARSFGRQLVKLRVISRVRRVADSPKYPVKAGA